LTAEAGPHRAVPPETTLARLRPLLGQFGITRVAVLTGLDTIGIPVAAAYRPNSRSIAVHQGKGRTLVAANVSAIMEAVECFHAEIFAGPLWWGRADAVAALSLSAPRGGEGQGEVGGVQPAPTLDASHVTLYRRTDPPHPNPLPPQVRAERESFGLSNQRILWTLAKDLASGRPVVVPFELVSADFTVPAPAGFGVFQQTTNGLGAGNTPDEAMLQGLYEVVERDAVAGWHAMSAAGQAARAVDPASVDGPASTWLLARLAAAGAPVRLWDISGASGLPAFLALVWDIQGVAGIEAESGAGCHASADVALARALAEAAQARLTRISGARDDFAPASYAPAARAARQAAAERLGQMRPARRFRPVCAAATPQADLDNALAALARAGCAQVACVDLTREEFGNPVVRIFVHGQRAPVEEAA